MKWLRRKLRTWVLDDSPDEIGKQLCISSRENDCIEGEPVLNFKVYNAIGGKVVEFRYYDRVKDRSHIKPISLPMNKTLAIVLQK
jgi:hypothetical protein